MKNPKKQAVKYKQITLDRLLLNLESLKNNDSKEITELEAFISKWNTKLE